MKNDLINNFNVLIQKDNPDYVKIREIIVEAYKNDTGCKIPNDIAQKDDRLKDIVKWMNKNHNYFDGFVTKGHLEKRFSASLSSKISSLAQHNCSICQTTYPTHIIPIRIRPLSHQTRKKINKNAFKAAIASKFSDKKLLADFSGKSLCMHILFVVNPEKTPSDIDNLAKLLNDALIGYIYDDDRAIEHLSLLRFSHDGEEEYIYIRIAATSINQHEDVLFCGMEHSWVGATELIIEDFYE
jgi:Holliday junction resolvase RusA-like endonuclease